MSTERTVEEIAQWIADRKCAEWNNPDAEGCPCPDDCECKMLDAIAAALRTERERADTEAATVHAIRGINSANVAEINRLEWALRDEREARVKAEARVHELETRLEMNFAYDSERNKIAVEPGSIPDGIECRDDTIKLQDERIVRLTARAEKAEAEVARLREALTGVIRVADRDAPEFRAARAALDNPEVEP